MRCRRLLCGTTIRSLRRICSTGRRETFGISCQINSFLCPHLSLCVLMWNTFLAQLPWDAIKMKRREKSASDGGSHVLVARGSSISVDAIGGAQRSRIRAVQSRHGIDVSSVGARARRPGSTEERAACLLVVRCCAPGSHRTRSVLSSSTRVAGVTSPDVRLSTRQLFACKSQSFEAFCCRDRLASQS